MAMKITIVAIFKVQKLGTLVDLVLYPVQEELHVGIVVTFAELLCCLVSAAFFRLSKSLWALCNVK